MLLYTTASSSNLSSDVLVTETKLQHSVSFMNQLCILERKMAKHSLHIIKHNHCYNHGEAGGVRCGSSTALCAPWARVRSPVSVLYVHLVFSPYLPLQVFLRVLRFFGIIWSDIALIGSWYAPWVLWEICRALQKSKFIWTINVTNWIYSILPPKRSLIVSVRCVSVSESTCSLPSSFASFWARSNASNISRMLSGFVYRCK